MTGPVAEPRPCFGCHTFDTHPRHEIITFEGADAHGGPMHIDCCAEKRNCDLCKTQLERAHDAAGEHLKGDALGAVLEGLPSLHVTHADTASSPFDVQQAQEVLF